MPSYKAPLRDMRFLLNEVFDFPAHYRALANGSDATPDMVEAILGECARLYEEVFGGHGYIREHGMEQIVRDARIATPLRRHYWQSRHSTCSAARCC